MHDRLQIRLNLDLLPILAKRASLLSLACTSALHLRLLLLLHLEHSSVWCSIKCEAFHFRDAPLVVPSPIKMDPGRDQSAQSCLKFRINFFKIRELLHNQKAFINALQPLNRSFSQPDLRTDLLSEFESLRDALVENTLKVQQALNGYSSISSCSCSQPSRSRCDLSDNESDQSAPPVPKPRKSVLHRRQNKDSIKSVASSIAQSTCDTPVETKQKEDLSKTAIPNTAKANLNEDDPGLLCEVINNLSFQVLSAPKAEVTATSATAPLGRAEGPPLPLPTVTEKATIFPSIRSLLTEETRPSTGKTKTSINVKAKHSFRQLLRINKITSNKFLSIRLNKDGLSRKKSLFHSPFDREVYKPRRPTRLPPPPPILVFRPAAPLPASDSESDLSRSNNNRSSSSFDELLNKSNYLGIPDSLLDGDDISELYHDAFNSEEIESIYCSVDEIVYKESDTQAGNIKEKLQRNENGMSKLVEEGEERDGYDETGIEQYDYYDDGECIYEELSSNEGTIYEEYDENVYDNAEAVVPDKAVDEQKRQRKRLKKVEKMMKRFHLNGDEIPVNAGIIKQDQKGSKNDLMVRKGETVLILRMVNNPPGKWLAKNERSKIGYVDLDNVYFDTESIKAVIKSFHNM